MTQPNTFLRRLNSYHLIGRYSQHITPVLFATILTSCSPSIEKNQKFNRSSQQEPFDVLRKEALIKTSPGLHTDIAHIALGNNLIECNFKNRRFNFGLRDLTSAVRDLASALLCDREGKIDQALKYREVASLKGTFTSSRILASQFETGDGVPKNFRRAYFYHVHVKDTVLKEHPNWVEYVKEVKFQTGGEPDKSWKVLIQETNQAQARLRPHLSDEDLNWVESELVRHRVYREEHSKRKREYYKSKKISNAIEKSGL